MKELSIEQKAKRYDEVIEKLRSLHDDYDTVSTLIDIKEELENIFPELKESEGEKIRKWLIGYFNQYIIDGMPQVFGNGLNVKDVIAWLEKQGEQKPVDSYCQENCKGFQETGKCFADGDCKAKREAESNDKNEPKFHEGDWVVSGQFVTQIREIAGAGYVNSHNGFIPFESAKYYHIWSIQDAKPGDVLACESGWTCIFKALVNDETFSSYCFMDETKWFCETGSECHTLKEDFIKAYNGKIYPATKEQRDTLFAKMKEAGCAFDFEKKELKKLGHSEVTKTSDQEEIAEIPFGAKDSELQEVTYFIPKGFHAEIDDDKVVIKKGEKPTTWSEDDEKIALSIEQVMNCASLLNMVTEKVDKIRTWLKSIKQRIGG